MAVSVDKSMGALNSKNCVPLNAADDNHIGMLALPHHCRVLVIVIPVGWLFRCHFWIAPDNYRQSIIRK